MQEKADSDLVRRQNRRIVLSALRRHGPLARVELGRTTGLSPASITSIAAQMIAENILEELDGGAAAPQGAVVRRGRPIVRLGLRPDAALVLAGNLSIDAIELALADFNGRIIAKSMAKVATYGASAATFSAEVIAAVEQFLASQGIAETALHRMGLAVQGLANARDGAITWSPAFAERNIALTQPLEARFHIPCFVANDANMIAEGLLMQEQQRTGTTATIFTGYGVGMGLIIHGEVYHGSTGGASEFGHMNHIPHGALCRCGRRGCIEAYAADYGILRSAEGSAGSGVPHRAVPPEHMASLLARARDGDAAAIRAFHIAGEALGFGIARLLAILNPDRVVVAGPGLHAAELIAPALQKGLEDGVLEELRRDVKIEFVSFETDMILRGTVDALLRQVDGELTAAHLRGLPFAESA